MSTAKMKLETSKLAELKKETSLADLTKPQVKELQTRLAERGFDPGGIDGLIGSNTTNAWQAFKVANKLDTVGPASLKALLVEVEKPSPVAKSTSNISEKTGTSKSITDQDFCNAAKRLRCDVAAIQAVAEVETRGRPFYADGFPVILFERHWFYRKTDGKYSRSHPEICNRKSGGYGKAGANQRRKFSLAFGLNPNAAMESCSWGRFQIMGFHWKTLGYASPGDFVDAMKRSEGDHLSAFCAYIEKFNLADELRNHQWAALAKGYNGAGYRKNAYDTKLAAAHKEFSKNPIDCNSI